MHRCTVPTCVCVCVCVCGVCVCVCRRVGVCGFQRSTWVVLLRAPGLGTPQGVDLKVWGVEGLLGLGFRGFGVEGLGGLGGLELRVQGFGVWGFRGFGVQRVLLCRIHCCCWSRNTSAPLLPMTRLEHKPLSLDPNLDPTRHLPSKQSTSSARAHTHTHAHTDRHTHTHRDRQTHTHTHTHMHTHICTHARREIEP